jgi:hypothetical protein
MRILIWCGIFSAGGGGVADEPHPRHRSAARQCDRRHRLVT